MGDRDLLEAAITRVAALLESPLTALVVALILGGIALSGRLSVRGARAMFFAAWLSGLVSLSQFSGYQLVLALCAFTALVVGLALWFRPETVPKYFGELIPARRLLFSSANLARESLIEIGDSGTIFKWGGPQGQPLFNFYGSNLIVESIRGKVKVSTTIKDKHGRVVAELVRNAWKVAPPPHTWDRNYTKDALEVKDAYGNIVLQVQVLPDRIRLQGEWWGDEISGVRLVKSPDPASPGGLIEIFGPKHRPDRGAQIVPIFRYPSEKFFGVRTGTY